MSHEHAPAHDHGTPHDPSHEAGHHHHHDHGDHHHDDDPYYLDQLCMVGLAGAFGAICLALYFFQRTMLDRMLGSQFHPFVLASGFALVIISGLRAISLWKLAQPKAHDHAHAHEHEHHEHHQGHEHVHAACDHQHAPGETCDHHHDHGPSHVHGHDHGHFHGHGHDHGHEDHDHGWAPWRYVLLLLPITLFLLGMPNKGPAVGEAAPVDVSSEAAHAAGLLGISASPWATLGHAGQQAGEQTTGDVAGVDYKILEGAAQSPDLREQLQGKRIEVRGQFAGSRGNPYIFGLVRFRIQCCAADAVRLNVSMIAKEPITNIKQEAWVKVRGKVEFHQRGETYRMVVIVQRASDITPCDPDINPYIQ